MYIVRLQGQPRVLSLQTNTVRPYDFCAADFTKKRIYKTKPPTVFLRTVGVNLYFAFLFCVIISHFYFVSFLPFLPWRSRMMKRVGVPSSPNTSRI